MLLSSIVKMSSGKKDVREFKKEISNEVETYKKLLSTNSTRIPIIFEEDADLDSINFTQLFSLIQTGQLDAYESSYIADAITLSEHFNCLKESDAYLLESIVVDLSN
ncbi:MAG: hypothetical protein WKF89_09640 [Chitinophagaceae bacterium]